MTAPQKADEFREYLYGRAGGGSHERPWKVLEWAMSLDTLDADDCAAFWNVVTEAWPSFDAIPHEHFEEMFGLFMTAPPPAPREQPFDNAYHKRLLKRIKIQPFPGYETVTVYRGQDAAQLIGLSWSLDLEVAKGFASGFRYRNRNPVLLETQISVNDVAFICNDRGEQEVVLLNMPKSSVCKTLTLEATI